MQWPIIGSVSPVFASLCVVSIMGRGSAWRQREGRHEGGGMLKQVWWGFFSPFLSWSPTPNPAGLIFSPFFFSVFESHAKSFLQGMDWNILLSLFLFKD